MLIEVITVGAVREPYLKEGIADYVRRLRRYVPLALSEVPTARIPPGVDRAEVEAAKAREARAVLRHLGQGAYGIALDERGEMLDSPQLAHWLNDLAAKGVGRVVFLIGGARGLASEVLDRADFRLSLSRLTFTHEMACLILLEQLYRAFKINRGEPYHY